MIPGWYPGYLQPYNGDFVKDQVRLLRQEGLDIDTIYADLNIRYLYQSWINRRQHIIIDSLGNLDYITTGAFIPKNTPWGLQAWIMIFSHWVGEYIRQVGPPDIIHAHTYLGAIVAQQVNKNHQIPYIVTEHYTGWIDDSISYYHKKRGISAFNEASAVAGVGHALAHKIDKITRANTLVLPNFINLDLFNIQAENKSRVFHIIGVGDLIPRKQWSHLIQAFKLLLSHHSYVTLEIIGSGKEKNNLVKMIDHYHLSNQISLPGQLDKQAIAHKMREAHLLVHTSSVETFGLVLIEALASGIPVVSYKNSGSEDIITSNQLGHLTPLNDIEALFKSILYVLDNYDHYSPTIMRAYVEKKFSAQSYKKALCDLIKEMRV